MSEERTLEESFKELDELIEKMQTEDLPLEEAFTLYKRGIELVQQCNDRIQKVECDIQKLNPAGE
ncbi:MAG: exodeoxyribonuclease VII small subunit [Lachnospiraceae bacterium]|nr:exodeoxyribonuclease VII small subunit [Lachnospiraceae bacterium]